ncbi:FecR family protein [Methyloglobulus sp.]|uniref:FecR family protein n=1 Tax=Methyloglobulus sp. TaxID=2518622 RepID=UPI0018375E6D|nr:FecR family protein [Methyloglobulus sp.]
MNPEPEATEESLADQAIDWLVLLRSGNVSADLQQEFNAWLQQDVAHREAYANAETLWRSAAKVMNNNRSVYAQSQGVKTTPIKYKALKKAGYSGWATAATLLLLVWLGWAAYGDELLSDYSTHAGEQKQTTLADGSSVFLNTDTAIALEWTNNQRKIRLLKGQAEFKVTPDTKRPFDVMAGDASIRALGTVFEVYQDVTGGINVTVSEHAVGVSLENKIDRQRVKVKEGERLIYSGSGELPLPQSVNLNQSKAWQRGKLIFRDQPLTEVVAELNRYSQARIVLKGDSIGKLRVSGVFPIDALAVLNALQQAFAIDVTYVGSWLIVLHS